jgi:hypothetical protein
MPRSPEADEMASGVLGRRVRDARVDCSVSSIQPTLASRSRTARSANYTRSPALTGWSKALLPVRH